MRKWSRALSLPQRIRKVPNQLPRLRARLHVGSQHPTQGAQDDLLRLRGALAQEAERLIGAQARQTGAVAARARCQTASAAPPPGRRAGSWHLPKAARTLAGPPGRRCVRTALPSLVSSWQHDERDVGLAPDHRFAVRARAEEQPLGGHVHRTRPRGQQGGENHARSTSRSAG